VALVVYGFDEAVRYDRFARFAAIFQLFPRRVYGLTVSLISETVSLSYCRCTDILFYVPMGMSVSLILLFLTPCRCLPTSPSKSHHEQGIAQVKTH
jgi:hypothetical protein